MTVIEAWNATFRGGPADGEPTIAANGFQSVSSPCYIRHDEHAEAIAGLTDSPFHTHEYDYDPDNPDDVNYAGSTYHIVNSRENLNIPKGETGLI